MGTTYDESLSDEVTFDATVNDWLGWYITITENSLRLHDSNIVNGMWHVDVVDDLKAEDMPFPGFLALLSDIVRMHDSIPTWKYIAGAIIHEILKIHPMLSPKAHYSIILASAIKLKDLIRRSYPVSISQHVTVADLHKIVLGISVMNRLVMRDRPAPAFKYTMRMLEAIIVDEALARFFGASFRDSIGFTSTLSPLWQYNKTIAEEFDVTDKMTPQLIIRVDMRGGLEITDEEVVRMIYKGDWLEDKFSISACYVDPGGGFTTWVINTRTSAVTEYKNFNFNSIVQMGGRFLGATSDGLYILEGPLDDGASIPTRIKSGLFALGGSHFTSFKAAYLGLRVRDNVEDFLLKLHSGDDREYVYRLRPEHMMTTKINLGKGLRARYFSWELITPGEDYDLDSVEFVPIVSKRRV